MAFFLFLKQYLDYDINFFKIDVTNPIVDGENGEILVDIFHLIHNAYFRKNAQSNALMPMLGVAIKSL